MNPFVVFNLPYTCSDADVRARYQELVRRYPPETKADFFQHVQNAHQHLRTERARWQWLLFHQEQQLADSPIEVVRQFTELPGRRRPPGREPFRQFLRATAKAARQSASS